MSFKLCTTIDHLYDLTYALKALHGHAHPVLNADGKSLMGEDGKALLEVIPYQFGGGVRVSIALWLMKLQPIIDTYEQVKMAIIVEAQVRAKARQGDQPFEAVWNVSAPEWQDCQKQVNEASSKTVEVELDQKLKVSLLNPDQNGLSPELLIALEPLLDLTA